jgi:hypothetical protein
MLNVVRREHTPFEIVVFAWHVASVVLPIVCMVPIHRFMREIIANSIRFCYNAK